MATKEELAKEAQRMFPSPHPYKACLCKKCTDCDDKRHQFMIDMLSREES